MSKVDPAVHPPRLTGTVRGLGVCDALHIELQACQLAALTTAVERAESTAAARIRAALPAHAAAPFTLTAPTDLALSLVSACLDSALANLRGASSTEALEAAGAWITTALDCRAVEHFCFEPNTDPPRASA